MDEYKFDIEEFKESYAHYRHLEQERSRHLAFFFTLVAGLLGILGILLKDGKPVTDWFLFVGCLNVIFLQVLTIVIFAAIRRIGDAREAHREQMSYLRGKMSSDKYIAQLWRAFLNKRYLSVHRAAEITLLLFAAVFLLITASGAIYSLKTGSMKCWQATIVLILTIAIFVAQILAEVFLGTKKTGANADVQPNSGVQPTSKSERG
jgi:NADH:ubiquinone oxidoreductase subunit 3 (subunit A)